MSTLQQVLVRYLKSSALDSAVIGWARYDGTGQQPGEPGDSSDRGVAGLVAVASLSQELNRHGVTVSLGAGTVLRLRVAVESVRPVADRSDTV